jgi:SWI/SNF-related matrix-associated actin-dependent regulator 1 of chromatin subfamily A
LFEGKTVQCIAFLGYLNQSKLDSTSRLSPHLIVVPSSTLSNWENEITRFCPFLNYITYHGSQSERLSLRYDIRGKLERGEEIDIILCTYNLFERESNKDDRKFLRNLKFDYMVCDEGHCLKNAKSFRYLNLKALMSKRRLLLSGTPVQNNVGELLSMLSFLMPRTFTSAECEILFQVFSDSVHNKTSLGQVGGWLVALMQLIRNACFIS